MYIGLYILIQILIELCQASQTDINQRALMLFYVHTFQILYSILLAPNIYYVGLCYLPVGVINAIQMTFRYFERNTEDIEIKILHQIIASIVALGLWYILQRRELERFCE